MFFSEEPSNYREIWLIVGSASLDSYESCFAFHSIFIFLPNF